MAKYKEKAYVDVGLLRAPLPLIKRRYRTIDSFADEEIPIYFRFRTKDQLHRLMNAFHIEPIVRAANGHVFHGEELLLCSLYRLHRPTTISDAGFKELFGLSPQQVSNCFNTFVNFMCKYWGYLLTDNLEYWKPMLPACAEVIRHKVCEEGCYFPPANDPNGGFNIFGFIDNTMNATCRPGGGPTRDGSNAPRNDPLIQRAFYNGWKKLHGLKWQTVALPNGMNFHVFGPVSMRHNDIYTCGRSSINRLISELQAEEVLQFCIYGDSAYIVVNASHIKARHNFPDNTERESLENRVMSTCREAIEWNYGDVGRMWALLDYKKVLRMRQMPVAKMYLVALILKDAYTTMNGSNTSEFFSMNPPTLEHWTGRGPLEMELNENYEVGEYEED